MVELERELRELGRELEYPPTPDLAAAVGERLRAQRPRLAPLRTRRIAIAAALALLLPAGAAAALPDFRDAVLEALGIKGVKIERSPTPLPRTPVGELDLGRRIAPSRAAALVDFDPAVAALRELGEPDAVYHRRSPPGGALSYVYRAGAGGARSAYTHDRLVLTEFRGDDSFLFARKVAGPGTTVRTVRVGRERGVWLAGEPHSFVYRDARGSFVTETLRLAGDTLLWQRGPLTLRLEGARSLAAALHVARSVR
jgi:hypothetical protein